MRKLRERRKAETSGVASEPGVASTSRAAQAMDTDTDSEQSTQIQTEGTKYSHFYTLLDVFTQIFSVVSLKYYPPHFFISGNRGDEPFS
jgi:hypothetical protein